MTAGVDRSGSGFLTTVGDFRWLRGHVSTFFVGIVLIICINMIADTSRPWSVTATGIWLLLLAVHGLVLIIARLSVILIAETDDEEVVLLPVQDALIVHKSTGPDSAWADSNLPVDTAVSAEASETVSWQIATDAAQHRKPDESNPGESDQ